MVKTSIDCAIIAIRKRFDLVKQQILPSVLRQGLFGEVVVVGDFEPGSGYRYIPVPDVTKTTLDALMKRDTAAVALRGDAILYLCDDHCLLDGWTEAWQEYAGQDWGILAPARFTEHHGEVVQINNGLDARDPKAPYVGGHAGVYRRELLRLRPWLATPHDLFWDVGHSRQAIESGFRIQHAQNLRVLDIDTNPAEKERHFTLGVLP